MLYTGSMKTLIRWIIPFVLALCVLGLAACADSPTIPATTAPEPSSTSMAVLPTKTPRPTETSIPTPTPTLTPVPTSTPLPTIVRTTYVLTAAHPTDQQVAQLLLNRSWLNIPQRSDGVPFNQFAQQDIDVDGDGQAEIVVAGKIAETSDAILYFAVLDQVHGVWEQVYTDKKYSHYCGEIRATVETDHIAVDFLTCGGGTGILEAWWNQAWIRCEENSCRQIWSAELFDTGRSVNFTYERGYQLGYVEQPDADTIQLTTHNFATNNLLPLNPVGPPSSITGTLYTLARRSIGPDTIDTYRWNGTLYQLESHEQITPGYKVVNEFDEQTNQTVSLVNAILGAPFQKTDGGFDSAGYSVATNEFWGPSAGVTWGDRWAQNYADAAAHNGELGHLGEWIAAVMRVGNDRPVCRLTVQHNISNTFTLAGRVELPCTSNFTRLSWVDVTGDGRDDLMLITLPPDEELVETGAGVQRLYVYDVSNGLREIARLNGAINGADGAGIRWRETADGKVEILAGIPFLSLDRLPRKWPILERRFQVDRWDAQTQSLVPKQIEIEP